MAPIQWKKCTDGSRVKWKSADGRYEISFTGTAGRSTRVFTAHLTSPRTGQQIGQPGGLATVKAACQKDQEFVQEQYR
jgi:hypothetical protein